MRRAWSWQAPALIACYAGWAWGASRFGRWIVDDSGITYAYAQRLAAGLPLSVNVGEAPVEGYSNPTWMALCAVAARLGLFAVPTTPKVLAACAIAVAMGVSFLLSRDAFGDEDAPDHLLPAVLMAGTGTFVQWTISGLENPLYVCFILAALWAHVRVSQGRAPAGVDGLLAFLVATSRPEGAIYAVAFGADRLVRALRGRDVRPALAWVFGAGVPGAAYLAWHLHTFEDLLPNTYYAKLGEGGVAATWQRWRGGLVYVRKGLLEQGLVAYLVVALALLAAPRALWKRGAEVVPVALLLALFAPTNMGGDWMKGFRMMSPVYPLLGLGCAGALRVFGAGLPRVHHGVATGVAALALAVTQPATVGRYVATSGMELDVQLRALDAPRKWMAQLGRDSFVIAMPDLGGAAMTTDEHVVLVDLFGLVDRKAARLLHAPGRDGADAHDYLFRERNVDLMRIVEPNYRKWRLDTSTDWAEGYLPLTAMDDRRPVRAGMAIRRDLVSAPLPADVVLTEVGGGVQAGVQHTGTGFRLWWSCPTTTPGTPTARLVWLAADGHVVAQRPIRAFGGVFPPLLFSDGAPLFQDWRQPVPKGAVDARLEPAPGAKLPEPVDDEPEVPAQGDDGG